MKHVISKQDSVEIQVMKPKAMLLPGVKPTKTEIRAMEKGRKEIARGERISGRDPKELSWFIVSSKGRKESREIYGKDAFTLSETSK